jgi:RNA polymerase sigma factor (sigma-70 family)
MEDRGELRKKLLEYVRRKFWSRAELVGFAEDIVADAFLDLYKSKRYSPDKENFGYLSVACVRVAFRYFKAWDIQKRRAVDLDECLAFVSEDDFVDDIIRGSDTASVLASLETLKRIEKIIITQRYYSDFTFAEIADANGLKLNTVLTHHRRALEKLRPVLTAYFEFGDLPTKPEED